MKSEEFVPRLHYYKEGEVVMFSTTRHGGVSQGEYASFNINEYCGDTQEAIDANRKALCDELAIDEAHLVMPHQTHGVEVRQIAADFIALPENIRRMILEGVDAVMTNESGICIGVSTADCIPILIYDKAHHAVCAVHAGWRGTVSRIVERAVRAMALAYQTDTQDLQCIVGPGISFDAFEVGMEVYDQFRQAGFETVAEFIRGKWHIDLKECNRQQLVALGVKPEAITVSPICTYNDNVDFFSARKQGTESGRIFTGAILS